MAKSKLVIQLIFIGLIIGAVIGIAFLITFIFMLTFNWFADMMIIKGANNNIASVVALILTVYVFIGISRNNTVNNYVMGKRDGKKRKG